MQRSHTLTIRDFQCPLWRWTFGVLTVRVLTVIVAMGFMGLGVQRADASCGDYLSHDVANPDQPDLLPTSSNHGPINYSPADHGPLHKQCHGPMCRQRPIQLPLSARVITLEPQDRWVWMSCLMVSPPVQTSSMAQSNELYIPRMIAHRLDRPPRI